MSSREIAERVEELRCKTASIGSSFGSCLFIDLPLELEHIVDALLRYPSSDEIIIDKFRVSFKHYDLLRLNSGVWLNDEVINFFMKLFEEREKAAADIVARDPNLFMNTFFYVKLVDHGIGFKYSNVKKWFKGVEIFSCNRIFIPINMSQHWSLVCILIPTREVLYIDSLGKDGRSVMANISKWLKSEWSSKHNGCEFLEFTQKSVKCPQQLNGDDCGIFTLAFVDLLSHNLSIDVMSQSHCAGVRKLIAFWIIRGRLVCYPTGNS